MVRERKTQLRQEARARRQNLGGDARVVRAARIRERIFQLPEVRAARSVGCYVSVHSEVSTRSLIGTLLLRGTQVAVPVVEPPERMILADITDLSKLVLGPHGIPEPPSPHLHVPFVDVVIVPGLLFTTDGHRLGNGGGYFDRLLSRMPGAFRVGLAYDDQVVDDVPREEHDEMLDALVTDAETYRFTRTDARGAPP